MAKDSTPLRDLARRAKGGDTEARGFALMVAKPKGGMSEDDHMARLADDSDYADSAMDDGGEDGGSECAKTIAGVLEDQFGQTASTAKEMADAIETALQDGGYLESKEEQAGGEGAGQEDMGNEA